MSSPSRLIFTSAGEARTPSSSTRNDMVWFWPTMPNRGAAISTTRRSFSSGVPVMRAWTGAAKPSAPASAGNTVGRHIGERRIECAEQPRAVSLAVRLARLDHPRLNAGNALEPLGDRGTRRLGLGGAVAEILARAF